MHYSWLLFATLVANVPPAKSPSLPTYISDRLQAHDVGVKLLHGMAQVVDFKALARPDALHALVDVVGRHPKQVCRLGHWANLGNIRMASALDGE